MSSTITALTSGGGLAMAGDTSGQLQLLTNNGTAAITIDTAQNVCINTPNNSNTGAGVEIQAKTGQSGLAINGFSGENTRLALRGVGGGLTGITANTAIYFSPSNTEAMRLSATGELLWGCTATSGSVPTTSGLAFAPAASAYDNVIYFRNGADPTYVLDFYNTAGSRAGKVTVNASTTSYDTSSDYRLKENVAPMSNALATVALLKPVTYTWKATNEAGQGFIAHELQEILPDAVTGKKDGVDKNGNPDYQGVDASFLVATLTAAIQELNAKVDAQALEIQALKGVA